IDLPSDGASEATDLFVDAAGVVYASGYYQSGGSDIVAYWADGVVKDLETNGRGTGIHVTESGVVYVSGYYHDGTRYVASYWRDDAQTVTRRVLHSSSASRATDLWVDPDGVAYAAGYFSSGSHDIAAYWTDTAGVVVREDLYTAGLSQANAVNVDGTDVYVAGRYLDGSVFAAYWINDGSGLSTLNGNAANARDITRAGSTTYIVGDYLRADFVRQAALWDGTGRVDLVSSDSSVPTFAYGITVYQGDVYVTGVHNPSVEEAVYWDNGSIVELSAGIRSKANAVVVSE
ncbi:MAG: hypothetical protein KAU31_07235, partial [Spirochaetaceae bacterium]|nr:hypothetical protein [Spirochaetaceae bacterium]